MFCRFCGKELAEGSKFCPNCGEKQDNFELKDVEEVVFQETPNKMLGKSEKSRLIASLLAFFLGCFGVHRFYCGKIGTGILQILLSLCYGLGFIWVLIDFIMIVGGKFKDKEGNLITDWDC